MPIQRIPFAQPIETRDGDVGSFLNKNKDSLTKNLFFDSVGNDKFVQKRPGTTVVPPLFGSFFSQCTVVAWKQASVSYASDATAYAYAVVNDYGTGAKTGVWLVNSDGNVSQVTLPGSYTPVSPALFSVSPFDVMLADQNNCYVITDGAVKFDLGNGKICSVTVNTPGTNYFNPSLSLSVSPSPTPPSFLFTVPGSGASANTITNIAVTNQGSKYIPEDTAPTATVVELPTTLTINQVISTTQFLASWTLTACNKLPVGATLSGTGVPGGTTVATAGSNGTVSFTTSNPCTLSVGSTITATGNGSGATVTIVKTNFPGSGGTGCGFNNRAVIYQPGTAKIWSSNVGSPTRFDPLNFVSAESYPDNVVGLVRHLNYVVAFGVYSTQFFYDNGNSVGNSLSPALSYNQEIGLYHEKTIAQLQEATLFVGRAKDSSLGVYMLSGSSIQKLSVPAVDRILKKYYDSIGRGFIFSIAGHSFYVLHYNTSDDCLVFDMVERSWHWWTFPLQFSNTSDTGASPGTQDIAWGATSVDPSLVKISPFFYQDIIQAGTSQIPVVSQTDILDGGVTKRKFFRRAEAIGNKTTGTLTVQYSDDDYNTWAGGRTVDLAASRSQMYGLGQSRRRAFRFTHQANQPLRLLSTELQYDIGELENDGVIEPVYRR